MGELIGYADQITSYGFSSTDLGNKTENNRKQGQPRIGFIR